jgi:hypothetical protein
MLKKAARDFLILFGLATLWACTSRDCMAYLSNLRDVNTWWGSYQCLNGDLVSMCYLDGVRQFNPPPDTTHYDRPPQTEKKNTVVYLDGDSYTYYWHLRDTNFAGACAFHYIDRYHGAYYHLDTTRRNVMVIEISERLVREYFSTPRMIDEVTDSAKKKKSIAMIPRPAHDEKTYASILPNISVDDLFNKNINQNMEFNLFNYNFIIPMFECKAALNYYVFNRASGDVVISDDRNFLFLKSTVTRTDSTSSYGPLTAEDITRLVGNLNTIYDHFRAEGFAEIYLSIIPNSPTINQPQGYNNMIPLIQYDPRLRMKYVDAYAAFRATKEVLYRPGDTHWNKKGLIKWIATVNGQLVRDAAGK